MAEHGPFGPPFEAPELDEWLAVVERDLRGGSFDERLVRRGLDGLETRPLYTAEDLVDLDESGWPGQAPWTRGRHAAGGWRIVQEVSWPDPVQARAQALDELQGGADGVLLVVDATGVGRSGVRLPKRRDLHDLVAGLPLKGRVLALQPQGHFLAVAAALDGAELPADCTVHLGADPVAILARDGVLPGGSRALGWLGDIAAWSRQALPGARSVAVDTSAVHLAGATEVDDLAVALATGVTYLRALQDAGLSVSEALAQVVFRVPVDTEMLGAICKLRALRRAWGRVAQACGAGQDPAAGAFVHAVPAWRRLTVVDPWVNLLRGTAATFAAACGGADLVTTAAFDGVAGQAGPHGRRLARNTQLVLALESHLGRIVDPAGGAFYFEERTDALARAAWARFQEIEALGGIVPALERGELQRWVAASREARERLVSRRKLPITGVSEFPRLDEERPELPEPPEPPAPPSAPDLVVPHLPDPGRGELCAALVAALAGPDAEAPLVVLTELAELDMAPQQAEPLPPARLSAPFETLRLRSDRALARTGRRPAVFLATLGRLAEHTARTTFTGNLLAAGGLQAVEGPGGEDLDAMAAAFAASGCKAAVLCSSDARYAELAVGACSALRAAGATQVWLAGRPGALAEALQQAGLTDSFSLGGDALAVLEQLWADALPAGSEVA